MCVVITQINQSHGKVPSKALAWPLVSQFRKVIELKANAEVNPAKKKVSVFSQISCLKWLTLRLNSRDY